MIRAWAGTTIRKLGFDTLVVSDGAFTFDRLDYDGRPRTAGEVHALSLANLEGEYARILTTAQILAATHA